MITLIAAMSRDRVIGRDGRLPWRMPADLRRFKARTMDHAVIMGRKTWDSMDGRPLPGRSNIVVTRDRQFQAAGAIVAHSLGEAIALARRERPDQAEVFVAGGAEIFRLALPTANVIDLTVIDVDIGASDAHFPVFEDDAEWTLARREDHSADDANPHHYHFMRYERRRV